MEDAANVPEVCPGCGVAYEIPAREISAAGRRVRCVRCAETWFALPAAAVPPDPEIPPTESAETHAAPGRWQNPISFWLGWSVTVALVGGAGAYVFREPLGREFPVLGAALERYAAWASALF